MGVPGKTYNADGRAGSMTKAERIQLLIFVQDGVKSSYGINGMNERWARLEKRLPASGDHDRIMSLLQELRDSGLIDARDAILGRGKTPVLMGLDLTEKGENALYRGQHPFWFLSAIWNEIKDFAATVTAKRLDS